MKRKYNEKNGQFHLNKRQVEKLINSALSFRDKLMIELLYYCGLRRSELIQIQLGDIDKEKRSLNVHGKGGKERIVPIPDRVMSDINLYMQVMLVKYRKSSNRPVWLFESHRKKSKHIVPEMVNYSLAHTGIAANIKHPDQRRIIINPHLLRHSAARRLKDAGLTLEAIAGFLGHTDIRFAAETYGLLSIDERNSQVLGAME